MIVLSTSALDIVCRSLADHGEDFGWNVYYKGNEITATDRERMVEADENSTAWLEAWDVMTAAYTKSTGDRWYY